MRSLVYLAALKSYTAPHLADFPELDSILLVQGWWSQIQEEKKLKMEAIQAIIEILKIKDLKPANAVTMAGTYALVPEKGLCIGDHIIVPPAGNIEELTYYHHGIYVGFDEVAHFHGTTKENSKLDITPVQDFMGQRSHLFVVPYITEDEQGARVAAVEAARMLVTSKRVAEAMGFKKYHASAANCETFAYFCKTGEMKSDQALKVRKSIEEDISSGNSKIFELFGGKSKPQSSSSSGR